jgi:hypothetical protein
VVVSDWLKFGLLPVVEWGKIRMAYDRFAYLIEEKSSAMKGSQNKP